MSGPVDALKDYLKGVKITEVEIDKRKETCMPCVKMGRRVGLKETFPFIGFEPICKACGCYLDGVLGKWAAPKETCPLNKWQ